MGRSAALAFIAVVVLGVCAAAHGSTLRKADDVVIPVPIDMGSHLTCRGTGEKAIREPAKEGLMCCQNIKWKVPRWASNIDGSLQDHGWNEEFTKSVDVKYKELEQIMTKPPNKSYTPHCLKAVIAARCLLNFNKCQDELVQIPCRKVCHYVHLACEYDIDTIHQFNCDESVWDQDNEHCATLDDFGFDNWTVPDVCTFEPKGAELAGQLQKEMHLLKTSSDQARRNPDEANIAQMRRHISAVEGLTRNLNGKVDKHMEAATLMAAGMPEGSSIAPLVTAGDMVGAPSSSVEYGGKTGPSEQHISTKDSQTSMRPVTSTVADEVLPTPATRSNNEELTLPLTVDPEPANLPDPGGRLVSTDSLSQTRGAPVESEALNVGGR